jgi:iron complex outermembrane receptor protein
LREGAEVSADRLWGASWRTQFSWTWIDAVYDQPFGQVAAGNAMPAIPSQIAFASLFWAQAGWAPARVTPRPGLEAGVEWHARSRLWADDGNAAPAPGYGVFNARARHRVQAGPVMVEVFAGIDNLTDRRTIGSVIVNQAQRQYYEPGLPRSALLGLSARLPL